jgi:hypothetical protein
MDAILIWDKFPEVLEYADSVTGCSNTVDPFEAAHFEAYQMICSYFPS